jgi:acetyltransferase-like isoleucine patch superfamily enzyme
MSAVSTPLHLTRFCSLGTGSVASIYRSSVECALYTHIVNLIEWIIILFHLFRSYYHKIYWRITNVWCGLELRSAGIELGTGVKFFGLPVVQRCTRSRIIFHEAVLLVSSSHYTALGVNHPVVVRTLQAGAKIILGARVGISGGSICAAQAIDIGPDTLLGANVTVTDTDFHSLNPHTRSAADYTQIGVAPVKIGARVFIGTNSIILKGVTIGDNSIIGAGSVVTKSIPANVIAAGNPCRVIRALTELELRPPQSC